jgi:hypothetical protein
MKELSPQLGSKTDFGFFSKTHLAKKEAMSGSVQNPPRNF